VCTEESVWNVDIPVRLYFPSNQFITAERDQTDIFITLHQGELAGKDNCTVTGSGRRPLPVIQRWNISAGQWQQDATKQVGFTDIQVDGANPALTGLEGWPANKGTGPVVLKRLLVMVHGIVQGGHQCVEGPYIQSSVPAFDLRITNPQNIPAAPLPAAVGSSTSTPTPSGAANPSQQEKSQPNRNSVQGDNASDSQSTTTSKSSTFVMIIIIALVTAFVAFGIVIVMYRKRMHERRAKKASARAARLAAMSVKLGGGFGSDIVRKSPVSPASVQSFSPPATRALQDSVRESRIDVDGGVGTEEQGAGAEGGREVESAATLAAAIPPVSTMLPSVPVTAAHSLSASAAKPTDASSSPTDSEMPPPSYDSLVSDYRAGTVLSRATSSSSNAYAAAAGTTTMATVGSTSISVGMVTSGSKSAAGSISATVGEDGSGGDVGAQGLEVPSERLYVALMGYAPSKKDEIPVLPGQTFRMISVDGEGRAFVENIGVMAEGYVPLYVLAEAPRRQNSRTPPGPAATNASPSQKMSDPTPTSTDTQTDPNS
ncbi:hypothetical protein HK102_003450, partial [Quaeritorhiza haematococci]